MIKSTLVFSMLMMMTSSAAAQEYLAILECQAGDNGVQILKVSGTSAKPSFQFWDESTMAWGMNFCERREDSESEKSRFECLFSPGIYALKQQVDRLDSSMALEWWEYEINRSNGEYVLKKFSGRWNNRREFEEEARGSCRKTVEPKAQF